MILKLSLPIKEIIMIIIFLISLRMVFLLYQDIMYAILDLLNQV